MKILKYLFLLGLFGALSIFAIDYYVQQSTRADIYSDTEKIPAKKAALLLGTAKYLGGGWQNYFYTYRIEATLALWRAGKIRAVVVSGDNGNKNYDEATAMYDDLIAGGIPARYITRDYAGFRTLDSIVRARAIFELDDYIIISQRFHLERALFIAQAKGAKAIGFVAKDLRGTRAAYRMILREYLARTKAFLDLCILHTDPKFYGDRVKVEYRK